MDTTLDQRRKQIRADNTFLLALDGDVDFEPLSLRLVIDLMKRSDKVAAACGRIHPTGSGLFNYYSQVFLVENSFSCFVKLTISIFYNRYCLQPTGPNHAHNLKSQVHNR